MRALKKIVGAIFILLSAGAALWYPLGRAFGV